MGTFGITTNGFYLRKRRYPTNTTLQDVTSDAVIFASSVPMVVASRLSVPLNSALDVKGARKIHPATKYSPPKTLSPHQPHPINKNHPSVTDEYYSDNENQ